jgi:ribosomal protein S13
MARAREDASARFSSHSPKEEVMTFCQTAMALIFTAPFASLAFAQGVGTEVQRDITQESRIEQGLKSGQLSTGEAAKLERGEARIDRMEKNALKDGNLSQQEANRINRAQNVESNKINALKHNDVIGNPNSASSQRMQADVQRNINQQSRIEQGVQNGSLSNKEVSNLERGQARVNRAEARARVDGHVSANEQARIQNKENRQSRKIFREKHNNR